MTDDPKRTDQPADEPDTEHVEDLDVPAEQEGDIAGGMPCAATVICRQTNCGETV